MEETTVTEAVADVLKKIKAPNILVVGATGTGKSSLINAVFGSELAVAGAGFPITTDFNLYSNGLVNIYDSAGYELNEGSNFVKNIFQFLDVQQTAGIEKQIHIVWYVINAASARVQEFDFIILQKIQQYGIPIIIVLSQVDRASSEEIKGVKDALENFHLTKSYDAIEVAASPLTIRGKPICEPLGLEELVNKTLKQLPEIYADAVRIAQIVDLKSKRKVAWRLIAAAAVASVGSAFIPIPGASTGANLAVQASLVASIAAVYGFGDSRRLLQETYESISTTTLVGFTGATVGLDVIRSLIPFVGNVIAGGTAATVIVITGIAYASTFEAMAREHIDPQDSKETQKFLMYNFPKELKRYSDIVINTPTDLVKIKDIFINR